MITRDLADAGRDDLCTVDCSLLGRAVCYSRSLLDEVGDLSHSCVRFMCRLTMHADDHDG